MSKKILGLDIGTTSIGWALVNEAENENEKSSIIKLGVRLVPLTTDEKNEFEKGKPASTNANRTLKRSARRNLSRYKLRRDSLLNCLKENHIINDDSILTENGENTTFQTLELRSKAVNNKITLDEFARILITINKKRGYKSSRKLNKTEDGTAVNSIEISNKLNKDNITPGEYLFKLYNENTQLKINQINIPDFYKSDLEKEFKLIWDFQKINYPEILTDDFFIKLNGKSTIESSKLFYSDKKINTAQIKDKKINKKLEEYTWRIRALNEKLDIDQLAFVLCQINGQIKIASGYLGEISDRNKILYFENLTVGQFQYNQIKKNYHQPLKGQIFYRQDYINEFNKIWENQAKYYPEILTTDLQKKICNEIIFYQRKLKSQKGLISFCQLESKTIKVIKNDKIIEKTNGSRVAPKSSPLFQEFKIWQNLNDIILKNNFTKEELKFDIETKQSLFEHLNIKGNLNKQEIFTLLKLKEKEWKINFKVLQGNITNESLFKAYFKMMEIAGHDEIKWKDFDASKLTILEDFFSTQNITKEILYFNTDLENEEFENQLSYQLWHLLYSSEEDNSKSGNDKLLLNLKKKFGFKKEFGEVLINIDFKNDYAHLSTKAMRKIIPYLKENNYADACILAKYNHSKNSLTKSEIENKILKDNLNILPKNSLRNPIVEKILNQVVNVVNTIINDPQLGKPDEIRIELARELKKNTTERAELTKYNNEAETNHIRILSILKDSPFFIKHPSKADIIRYKLYEELALNGYKTLYSNTYIQKERLFSNDFDIEHIIPKSLLYDDSFSNKTIELKSINQEKGNKTANDFVKEKWGEEGFIQYKGRLEKLFKNLPEPEQVEVNKKSNNAITISKAKYNKLLKTASDLGDSGFIERDLRDTQYISKKTKEILSELVKTVITTTGMVTDILRKDWGLIDIMKELNLEKYKSVGLTEIVEKSNGQKKEIIIDWSKRDDQRHHAMDALTVAFTSYNHIQYINYFNARSDVNHQKHNNIIGIERKIKINISNEKKFKDPFEDFRKSAKEHLEKIIISYKNKNKVTTINKNKVAQKTQSTLTPRGELHKETVYGKILQPEIKYIKVNVKLTLDIAQKITNNLYKHLIINRLTENGNDPKKAFTGKNSLDKKPIYIDKYKNKTLPEEIKIVNYVEIFTIRKKIDKDLQLEKIIDKEIKKILENRLLEYNNNPKLAFENLDKNPIYLNKEKNIKIKRVTIEGVRNAIHLHYKKNHLNQFILDNDNHKIPTDYVQTGNNHHVAIFIDKNGDIQENVVSFFEAVQCKNNNFPIINKYFNNNIEWTFLFTMKQNEIFVLPEYDYENGKIKMIKMNNGTLERSFKFNPKEINLKDDLKINIIKKHLFRIQKIGQGDYTFRHIYETKINDNINLKNIAYFRVTNKSLLQDIVKVRINHVGKIVQVGEY